MKKFINTKKVIVAATILTVVLFVFPLSSFGKGGKGGGDSLICAFEGDIQGLVFDFGDGFTLGFEIDGNQVEATITSVVVQAKGQETTVVISPKQFIYNTNLSESWESSDWDYGKIIANATLDYGGGYIEEDVTLEFEFEFATIFEQFKIKKKDMPTECADLLDVTVPKKVDLFFEVTRTRLVLGIDEATGDYLLGDPFNLVLVIDKGKPVLVDTFDIYPLPPQ